jgi:hypothetical protein
MAEELNPKTAWEFEILNRWIELVDISEAFRVQHIEGSKDTEIRNIYAAKLTRLWLELLPKVEGRSEFGKEFIAEFMEFRVFYMDPAAFFEKVDNARLYELEEKLRKVLEQLKIT